MDGSRCSSMGVPQALLGVGELARVEHDAHRSRSGAVHSVRWDVGGFALFKQENNPYPGCTETTRTDVSAGEITRELQRR